MKMLLVLLNNQGQILLCRNESDYFVPTNGAEVDESFGFDSPQKENRWFWENCDYLCTGAIFALAGGTVPPYLNCMVKTVQEAGLSGRTAAALINIFQIIA